VRINRFKRLWPKLKPKLKKVALRLVGDRIYIDFRDLISEGIIAIKKCKTTTKNPKTVSYLITRGKFAMIKFIKIVETHARYRSPHDSCDDLPDYYRLS